MKLSTSGADGASAKDGKGEGVLEQASQRKSVIVALHSYDSHEIRKHPHRCFRAINLGLGRQLVRAGRSKIDAVARAPAQIAGRLDGHLCIRKRVSNRLMLDNGKYPAPL